MNFMDLFNDDAFSLSSLTAAINDVDHVPGRIGELAFAGVGEGVNSLTVAIESRGESLTLIPTTLRGAPAPQEGPDKGKIVAIGIPQVKLEATIMAHSIQGVRAFGSTNVLAGPQQVINQRSTSMARRHDLTLENLRMGAVLGQVRDADNSVIVDLFDAFGVTQEGEVDFALGTATTDVRAKCATVIRLMKKNAKSIIPASATVRGLASKEFFAALIAHANVKAAYATTSQQAQRFGDSYLFQVFPFGGIVFEEYQGTDDDTTIAVPANKVRFFFSGVPGLYAEYYAPADFMETVNTIGLPRYAKVAPDRRFNRFVELHTQQNPLPLCLRPKTLIRGKL